MAQSALRFDSIPFHHPDPHSDITALTGYQRRELALIGDRVQVRARAFVYRQNDPAAAVYVVLEGVLKSYRTLPSGKKAISAFLFCRDICGLAEHGRYVNCVQAITPVTLLRLPLGDLLPLIRRDAQLQFKFLMKVTQALRESQRRAIVIGRRDAVGRLAMFLTLMRRLQRVIPDHERGLPLPMSRADIADFLSLSRESMSRATRALQRRGILTFENPHLAHITDSVSLAKLAAAV